jgi:small conductance mechanosensitive channel
MTRVAVVVLTFPLMFSAEAFAQDELEAEESPDPEVIEAAVAAVLASKLDGFDPDPTQATTVSDPNVDLRVLELQLRPLALESLEHELEAWRLLLEEQSRAHSKARIALIDSNRVEDAKGSHEVDRESGDSGVAPERGALIETADELREARIEISDRLRVVLEAYRAKGGDEDVIDEYTKYDGALDDMDVDMSDRQTAMETIRTWAVSDHGGKRLAKKAGIFTLALLFALLVGRLIGAGVYAALKGTGASSELVRRFLRTWIRRVALLIGALWGLSLIDVSVTPLLAALGAAGFILAFALQNSLSNLASGLMIVFQRPFDVGDSIDAAGISGTVKKVSLFTTYLSTDENKQVIVPNNMIWDDVVVNATGADTRRLSIEFELDPEYSLSEVREILLEEMEAHPDVLKNPPPEVKLAHIGSDGMTFVCWPWVQTEHRDHVRWELVARVGEKLNVKRGATKAEVV